MCPSIINFDSVDFSERHPEEVMFLLTLSVYQSTINQMWAEGERIIQVLGRIRPYLSIDKNPAEMVTKCENNRFDKIQLKVDICLLLFSFLIGIFVFGPRPASQIIFFIKTLLKMAFNSS